MKSRDEVKSEVLGSMDTIRGMRRGFRAADIGFFMEASSAAITAALNELVADGVLTVIRKAGQVNVYGIA